MLRHIHAYAIFISMEQVDFRHLSVEVQEHLRSRAIYLVETAGYGVCAAAVAVGVRRQTVSG